MQKANLADDEIIDRLILIMLNEAAKCLEEDIVSKPEYLDMAMIMGTGYTAFRGGLLKYADSRGIDNIVQTLAKLEKKHGKRFTPAKSLLRMVKEKKNFY